MLVKLKTQGLFRVIKALSDLWPDKRQGVERAEEKAFRKHEVILLSLSENKRKLRLL